MDTTTTDPGRVFMGGLDPSKDGQFAYIWQDDAMQVKQNCGFMDLVYNLSLFLLQMVFHTATLMPNVKGDLQKSLNKKKMHIGNDYVAIVYNESGHPYTIGTVKCQFIYVVSEYYFPSSGGRQIVWCVWTTLVHRWSWLSLLTLEATRSACFASLRWAAPLVTSLPPPGKVNITS